MSDPGVMEEDIKEEDEISSVELFSNITDLTFQSNNKELKEKRAKQLQQEYKGYREVKGSL